MKRVICLLVVLLHFVVSAQTVDPEALEYYTNGCYKVYIKKYKEAVDDFSEALKRDTGFIQAYENRGVAKYYLEDYYGAIEDFTIALEINPEDFNTYGRRGWARFRLQDCRGAIEDFTKALEGDQGDAEYYTVRGEAKYFLQDYQGAIADFSKVVRFATGTRDQRAEALYWRGLAEIDSGHKSNGCLDFNKAVKLGSSKALSLQTVYCQ